MATSKMKIKKVCEWCGTTFYAQKLTTRFCSHRCNNLAYKEAVRQKRIQEVEAKVQTFISKQSISDVKDKEYLSFKEAATLLGLSKQAIYKMVYAGKLQAFRISSRLSFIRKGDIDRMLEARPYEQRQPKDTIPITDFYTTAEVKEKYHVNESWIFAITKNTAFHVPSIAAKPIGARNISMPTLPRKPQTRTSPNGTAHRRCKINSA